MPKKTRRFQWILPLIALTALTFACNLLGGIEEQVGDVAGTAQAAVTQAGDLITQVSGSGLEQTAQAMATELSGESGDILTTANAAATQMLSEESGLRATAEALATQGLDSGEVPEDIPMLEEREQLVVTNDVVTYLSPLEITQVADFYKEEMPANGWSINLITTIETEKVRVLNFGKDERKATVSLTTNPVNQSTVVAIVLR